MKDTLRYIIPLIIIGALLIAIILVCADNKTTETDPVSGEEVLVVFGDLAQIPGQEYLFYSLETRTVYYVYRTSNGRSGVGYMAPYISNGQFCVYDAETGEIVEVVSD